MRIDLLDPTFLPARPARDDSPRGPHSPGGDGRRRGAPTIATIALVMAMVTSFPAWGEALSKPERGRAARVASSSASPAGSSARAAADLAPPQDLTDVSAWIQYKADSRRAALPHEAWLFYRRGLDAWRSGNREEALRLVRGSVELDPTFVAPHQTLLAWQLFRDPGQALVQGAALLALTQQSFLFQLTAVANGLVQVAQALFLGLLLTGVILVALWNRELRHPWQERLSRSVSPRAARIWPWVFLILPYGVGLGWALPTVFFLALLWPNFKLRERSLTVLLAGALVAAPWVLTEVNRFAAPVSEDRGPFFGVHALESEVYSAARRGQLAARASQQPHQPFLQFALGWLARQAGDLDTAESAYRRALKLWPADARVMNNLGNVLAMKDRQEEAIGLYRKAVAADPTNAGAFFNLSQAHTQRFDYQAANEALSHASALNFDMVKIHRAQSARDGQLPLVDQWISPREFWQALLRERPLGPAGFVPPPAWRNHLEASGWWISVAAVVLMVLGLGLGLLQHRAIPLRRCSNCGQVVCRRCAERRRQLALCRPCAAVEARAMAPEFAKVLLHEHRRKGQRFTHVTRTIVAAAIPGFGLLAFRRVFAGATLLVASAALAAPWWGGGAPFSYGPRVDLPGHGGSWWIAALPWAVVYAISILGYLGERARQGAQSAPSSRNVRGRGGRPTRSRTPVAA